MAVAIARPAAPLSLHQRPVPPVCTFWLQGRCSRNPCRFFHPPLPPAAEHKPAPSSHKPPPRRILRRPVFEDEGLVVDDATRDHQKPQHPQKGSAICAESPTYTGQATQAATSLIASLAGHGGSSISGISLPCSSATLFTTDQDGFLKGWDCATGLCTQHLSLGQPTNCLFNSFNDPNWLFIGLATEVRVINLAANTQQSLPVGSPILSFTSLGDLLLAGLEQGSILIWKFDAASATFVATASLSPAEECLSAVLTLEQASNSAQATSKKILSGYADGTLRVWDLNTGKCMDTLQAHHGAITQILSCGIDWVLSASHAEGNIALWRMYNGMQTNSHDEYHLLELLCTHNVSDAEQCVRPLAMCGLFNEENTPILFVAYSNSTVQVLELPSFTERGKLLTEKPIQAMEIGPKNMLFLGSSDGCLTVQRWQQQK